MKKCVILLLITSLTTFLGCPNLDKGASAIYSLMTRPEIEEFESFLRGQLNIRNSPNGDELILLRTAFQDKNIGQEFPTYFIDSKTGQEYPVFGGVFSLKKFPGIIFKFSYRTIGAPRHTSTTGDGINRKENISLIQAVLKGRNLDTLELPASQYFEFPFNTFTVQIFAETKIDINLPNGQWPTRLVNGYTYFFDNLAQNEDANANLKKIFYQLTIFICKTEFWDTHAANIPLQFKNGIPTKLILVDTNDLFQERSSSQLLDYKDAGIVQLARFAISENDRNKSLGLPFLLEIRKAYLEFCGNNDETLYQSPIDDFLEDKYHYNP